MTAFQMWLFGGIVSAMFAIIMFMIANSITRATASRKKIYDLLEKRENDISDLKLDILKNYVDKIQLEKFEEKNDKAHQDLRKDILKYIAKQGNDPR